MTMTAAEKKALAEKIEQAAEVAKVGNVLEPFIDAMTEFAQATLAPTPKSKAKAG